MKQLRSIWTVEFKKIFMNLSTITIVIIEQINKIGNKTFPTYTKN